MKYFKFKSIPLEEEFPGIGQTSFDEFGNYIQIDAFEKPHVLKKTVLSDDETITEYEGIKFLNAFWSMTEKNIAGYEIQDATE